MTPREFPTSLVSDAALPIAIVSASDRIPRARPPRTVHASTLNTLLSGFAASPRFGFNQATWQAMSLEEQNKLVALAAALLPDDPASNNKSTLNLPKIVPRTGPLEKAPTPTTMKIINGGFETGLFPPGWNLTGTGTVLSTFADFTAPADQFMGFLSTGNGAMPDSSGRFSQFSRLSQPFQVTAGTLYTIKATYNFVSNEYPYWVNLFGGNSPFNDTFDIRVNAPNRQSTTLTTETVNTAFTPNQI